MEDCCSFDHDKVRELRKEKNLSQIELANKIGTYQHVISKIEASITKSPSYWMVCKISQFFKIPVEDLRKK